MKPEEGTRREDAIEAKREHHQVVEIGKETKPASNGRSHRLLGLKACRLAVGLTQRDLAQKAGSSRSTIRQLESGRRGAYASTIRRLCAALGVAPETLLRERGDEDEGACR